MDEGNFRLCFSKANTLSEKQYKKHNSTPTIFKVFIYIITNIQKDNSVLVPQKKIADRFGVDQAQISRAIKSLLELGYLVKLRKRSYYRLDPEIALAKHSKHQPELVAHFKEELKRYREENSMLKKDREKFDKKLDKILENQNAIKSQIASIMSDRGLTEEEKNKQVLRLVKES